MRNFLVPQSTQMDRVAARPFFMVTASMSREAVLALHLTQYISTGSEGVAVIGGSWSGNGCLHCNAPPLRPDPQPAGDGLLTLVLYVGRSRASGMVSPLPARGGLTRQVALLVAYHTFIIAGQQVP